VAGHLVCADYVLAEREHHITTTVPVLPPCACLSMSLRLATHPGDMSQLPCVADADQHPRQSHIATSNRTVRAKLRGHPVRSNCPILHPMGLSPFTCVWGCFWPTISATSKSVDDDILASSMCLFFSSTFQVSYRLRRFHRTPLDSRLPCPTPTEALSWIPPWNR
jgi:hypothetical protein